MYMKGEEVAKSELVIVGIGMLGRGIRSSGRGEANLEI